MVTVEVALPPFKLAVIVAWPTALDAMGKSAKSAPAAMLTEGGTEAMAGLLDARATAVATLGARETVTRSVPGVPLGRVSVAGVMLVTTGGGGVTCTRVTALVPFTEAVTFALPVVRAFTGIAVDITPAATVALAATCATAGASFASPMTVSASCATLMVTVRVPVAPSCSGSGLGSSDTIAAACGETCTLEVFEVPFADAVMTALPTARPVAVNTALVAPCATVTDAGICSTDGLSTESAIGVLVDCAALILTVKLLVAPTFIVKLTGSSAVTATGGATTLTIAEAVVPFRLAVMPAWPSASVPTTTGALVCPASTVTCAAIDTIPAGVADSETTVLVLCAAEIVSVSVVLAPIVTVDVAGRSDPTVGGAGETLIWLDALVPFKLAVT